MELTADSYEGPTVNGRLEGVECTYVFGNGNKYVGEMRDGVFHGHGIIHFKDGGQYEAEWEDGKAVEGTFTFEPELKTDGTTEGLVYAPFEWEYCMPDGDRRFWNEHLNGLKPAGESHMTNVELDESEIDASAGRKSKSPNSRRPRRRL